MKQKLLLVLLLAFSMLLFGVIGCEPDDPGEAFPPPNIEFGEMTDSRDGQTYYTIIIGTQTWMAENLNYETGNSWCYSNETNNCNIYGRLYDWETALTACPSGWHLPSDEEWTVLADFLGGAIVAGIDMKSTSNLWQSSNARATNESGWSGLPGGRRSNSGYFADLGSRGYWWSSTKSESNANKALHRGLTYIYNSLYQYHFPLVYGFSVRCVRDWFGSSTESVGKNIRKKR